MIIECCSQERTYIKFHGLIGERFAKLNRLWTELFESAFAKYYDTIHRYETNRLRNIARFFGHMLSSDAIGWHVLSIVHLNEEETTSSSRIFVKILFQDLAEAMGMARLQARLRDDVLRSSFDGIFPMDNPRNTRFSINYFTSIGMGGVTEEMREHLKNMPQPVIPALSAVKPESDSDSASSVSSYSSYTGSSRSYSRSRSPPRNRGRGRSYSRSVSRSRRRMSTVSYSSRSPTPPRRDRRSLNARDLRSRSPVRYRHGRSESYSRSPPPRARRRNSSSPESVALRRRRNGSSADSRSPPRRGAPARGNTNGKGKGNGRRESLEPVRRRRSPSYEAGGAAGGKGGRARAADYL
ncbi:MAG: hypothetical protein Q9187_009062 [Circinaria calcarea]